MKKRKQYNEYKKFLELIVGAQFCWQSVDPLSANPDITHTRLSHRNALKRSNLHKTKDFFTGITSRRKLKWKVIVEVEFKTPDGKTYYRGADMVIHGILSEADGHYQKLIEEIFAEAQMKHYVTTHMTMEVLGTDSIRETDFQECAA
jgi:hypothetical protein